MAHLNFNGGPDAGGVAGVESSSPQSWSSMFIVLGGRRSIAPNHTHHCAGCGCHGHGVFDVAVRMKQRRGLLTEPSPPQARPSRRRCDPGLRHSLTEEHGPVEDFMTVAPRSSLHESAGFMALIAERPPKVAVGFHPRSAITPNHLVAERRLNPLRAIGNPFHSRRCPPPSIVAPRRIMPVSSPSEG